jgi:hypothetical protein
MAIDVEECLRRAERCREAAENTEADLRALWTVLAETWAKMAQQAEILREPESPRLAPARAAVPTGRDAPAAYVASATTGA